MIENLKRKRFKICFKIQDGDKLKKMFRIYEARTESEIMSIIHKEYGPMVLYTSKKSETHRKPGILYIRPANEIRDGEITGY